MVRGSQRKVDMKPTVGRIVHYYSKTKNKLVSKLHAAVVAEVHVDGQATLTVLDPDGIHFKKAPQAETPTEGHWNWPPKDSEAPVTPPAAKESTPAAPAETPAP